MALSYMCYGVVSVSSPMSNGQPFYVCSIKTKIKLYLKKLWTKKRIIEFVFGNVFLYESIFSVINLIVLAISHRSSWVMNSLINFSSKTLLKRTRHKLDPPPSTLMACPNTLDTITTTIDPTWTHHETARVKWNDSFFTLGAPQE